MMRPLVPSDHGGWSDVRSRNEAWLLPWEPQRAAGQPDLTRDAAAFTARCTARDRDRTADAAYAFGLFIDQRFAGEVNLNNIVRGALQSGTVGYWIDGDRAGQGYVAESVVVLAGFAFEHLQLHRLEVCIVPRNANSRRVMEKLGFRCEGLSERYLEIAGVWEDHFRYAITAEEWNDRRDELRGDWL
jgi:ribosomal-protein-alanine N-acetyltransferase